MAIVVRGLGISGIGRLLDLALKRRRSEWQRLLERGIFVANVGRNLL
jgi:hypothetical protein